MMDKATAVVKASNKPQKATSFMIEKFVPGITALAKMDKGDFIQSLSNIVQRQRKEGWLHAFLIELNALCEQGKVKEDYMNTKQGQECRQELLDSLDKDKPDQEKLEAMKKIFLEAAKAPEDQWESNHPQQLMKVCRTLASEELIILGVAYHLFSSLEQGAVEKISSSAEQWPATIAKHSNGRISEGMVYFYEEDLVKKQLVGEKVHSDKSGVRYAHRCRLSPLGVELGRFLSE
ncbi:MAG: hypothetical protein WC840_00715 [Candidatus Peribacteraceae bacterium]